jgi:hypothetical protein
VFAHRQPLAHLSRHRDVVTSLALSLGDDGGRSLTQEIRAAFQTSSNAALEPDPHNPLAPGSSPGGFISLEIVQRSNRSHATSNWVSHATTRILKISDQRLARKARGRSPATEKKAGQRLAVVCITRGNVAQILASGTWPTETGLAGWVGRIRTHKCHLQKCPLKCGAISP